MILSNSAKEIEAIIKETAVLIGYLLKGLAIFLGKKAKTNGMPKAIQLAYWLKRQVIFLIRKLNEVVKPKVIKAGQVLKGLLILAARNIKTKGVSLIVWVAQLIKDLSNLLYKKAKKVIGDKVSAVRQDIAAEQTKASAAAIIPSSPEIILKEEDAISPNQRLAQEAIQNGIECKAITDMELYEIEKKHHYSYLFAMSPRIITNRGCIRLEGNGTRNIDLIQIIQKN
jgi:hypothetical protein